MKSVCRILLTIVFLTITLSAQDGKIISKSRVFFAPDTLSNLEARFSGVTEIFNKIELNEITYLSDTLKVKGFLAIPKQEGKYPCLIVNRGGNREFGALSATRALLWLGKLANWGYVVVASQYRGNAGGEGQEEFGGADVNDVINLIPLLASISGADTSRVGIYGWSRGGMMTYLALTKTNKFKAAVIGAGMANAFTNIAKRPDMEKNVYSELIPNYWQNKESELRARSAVYWADKLCKTTPILLLHGSADWRVTPDEGLEITNKLYELRHPFRFVFFEGGDHGLTEHRSEVNRLVKDWLNNYVRDGASLPNLEPHGK